MKGLTIKDLQKKGRKNQRYYINKMVKKGILQVVGKKGRENVYDLSLKTKKQFIKLGVLK